MKASINKKNGKIHIGLIIDESSEHDLLRILSTMMAPVSEDPRCPTSIHLDLKRSMAMAVNIIDHRGSEITRIIMPNISLDAVKSEGDKLFASDKNGKISAWGIPVEFEDSDDVVICSKTSITFPLNFTSKVRW